MRKLCLQAVHDLARQDPRVVFIGSDITNRDLARFAAEFPDRYFAEGISEGHLIGMTAGLAMSGMVPYLNTIATFLTRRCYEQVLLDLGLHRLPVRLIGSGGGVVYAPLGATHLATEDIAILRVIPNMTIVAVCDAAEMARLMPQTLDWPGPIYIRLAKGNDPVVSSDAAPFRIGKAIRMRKGGDALIISTGIATQVALQAAEGLQAGGVRAGVLHVHTIKPLDLEALRAKHCGRTGRGLRRGTPDLAEANDLTQDIACNLSLDPEQADTVQARCEARRTHTGGMASLQGHFTVSVRERGKLDVEWITRTRR